MRCSPAAGLRRMPYGAKRVGSASKPADLQRAKYVAHCVAFRVFTRRSIGARADMACISGSSMSSQASGPVPVPAMPGIRPAQTEAVALAAAPRSRAVPRRRAARDHSRRLQKFLRARQVKTLRRGNSQSPVRADRRFPFATDMRHDGGTRRKCVRRWRRDPSRRHSASSWNQLRRNRSIGCAVCSSARRISMAI